MNQTATANTTPVLSASIIVVREPASRNGLEVLLMERHGQTRNFGGALVFPGGKVDAGDARIAQDSGYTPHPALDALGLDAEQAQSLFGAALRETLEEAALLWLQASASATLQPQPGHLLRHALQQGGGWQAACQTLRLAPSVASFIPWSRWITPASPNMSSRRYDTFFFLASAPGAQEALADGHEATRLVWDAPLNFLRGFERGDLVLAPPQIMTLAHLQRFASAADLLEYARTHAVYCMAPVSQDVDGCRMVCFPGDALHDQPLPAMPGPTRLVLQNKRFMPPDGFASLLA